MPTPSKVFIQEIFSKNSKVYLEQNSKDSKLYLEFITKYTLLYLEFILNLNLPLNFPQLQSPAHLNIFKRLT